MTKSTTIRKTNKKNKVCVSLLIFCLVDLSTGVSGILKSPTIIVLLLISPFILVSICHTYCGALGAYISMIVISSSWIDPLIIMQCPSLSLFTAFVLKSILSDMCITTPAFFWSLFVWDIFFQPFTFNEFVGEKVVPILFLCHLRTTPTGYLKNIFVALLSRLEKIRCLPLSHIFLFQEEKETLVAFCDISTLSRFSLFFFSSPNYFYQLEANYFTIFQCFLPYIDMNQPWIYMCSPSRSPLPPPSSPDRSLQVFSVHQPCALVSCIQPGLVICFTLDNIHVLMLLSQIIPSSPSPIESKSLFYTSVYRYTSVYTYIYICIDIHLFFSLAYSVIITIFLNSIYMHQYTVLVFIFLAYFTLYNGLQF